ncbi:Uncharacterised protein [Burkholderia pseudomallei]|nr:hypothetical protein BOC51_05115 [Burkholderia pseudomallei]EIF70923.1 hypothetical protein BP354E_4957 [Burkholderia pseudomallei 354e]EIF73275.1 hypothetical protein BP354A_5761 [Burkholderia pseudomallei 354a]ONE00882.1 hypothetical protein AQ942_01925 [Burkholderia pseudomallei]CAJ3086264.1 Uncharacterised protein [Burkholderia pseudomallei]
MCEGLAHQLVPKAKKDAAAHSENGNDVPPERMRAAFARKDWVSPAELTWLISRVRGLLNG